VILIMTTNAGARDVSDRRLGFADAGQGGSTRGALERTFTPEFRNRIDAVVTFSALGTVEVERVVDKQIDELRGLVAGKGVTITLDPEARAWLARKGFDRAFGARPMARLIDRVVKKPLSDRLLFGSLAKGGAIRIAVEDDAIVVVEDGAGGA
jgi:ATP-dependent Clp protease ATP-binding subunit ClpA